MNIVAMRAKNMTVYFAGHASRLRLGFACTTSAEMEKKEVVRNIGRKTPAFPAHWLMSLPEYLVQLSSFQAL